MVSANNHRSRNQDGHEPVTVVGAGPAGLACAIVLARGGRHVVVRERHRTVGARFHSDLQGLENWSDYRDVLDEFPSHATARLWLARVLSWKGDHDESLAEYDRLLDLEPPADDIDVERAEVLSWSGRYDEALLAFDAILAVSCGIAGRCRWCRPGIERKITGWDMAAP